MKMVAAAVILPDIDHAAGDDAVAEHAHPAIIERMPLAEAVGLLQSGQFFVEVYVLVHCCRF